MKFTAQQIAAQLNGTVEGDTSTEVSELSKIEDAASGSLTFLSNPKYAPYIYKTKASIVIVHQDFKPERPLESTLIRVKDPYSAFSDLLDFYNKAAHNRTGIAAGAFVHKSATLGQHCYVGHNSVVEQNAVIGDNVKIYPQVFIGENVKIGKDCIIYPGTQILAGTLIGSDCIIHSGTVIGSDGFGFAPQEDGSYKKNSSNRNCNYRRRCRNWSQRNNRSCDTRSNFIAKRCEAGQSDSNCSQCRSW